MSSFSDFLENELLDHIFTDLGWTPPATLHVGLSTVAPTDSTDTGEVPSTNAYVRATTDAADYSVAAGGSKTNADGAITFPTATGSWGICTHFTIYDASTGGNMLGWAALTASRTIDNGETAEFATSTLTVTLD